MKKVSRVKFRIDNSDGTFSESETFMPHDIADKLHAEVIDWGSIWVTTFDDHDEYREAEAKFIEKWKLAQNNTI